MLSNQRLTCLILLLSSFLLASCSHAPSTGSSDSAPSHPKDISHVKNAVPKFEKKSRIGNPTSYVVLGKKYRPMKTAKGYRERGRASWYGTKFQGRKTSNGEVYDMYQMTAAHKTLPLPSYVKVKNLDNGKSVIVRVNDRGPFHQGRIIDLSYAAAKKLGVYDTGTARVEVRAVTSTKTIDAPVEKAAPAPFHYIVQAGAFRDRNNAQAQKNKLQQFTHRKIFITPLMKNNRKLYRVQFSPFKNEARAVALSNHLSDENIHNRITLGAQR